MNPLECQLSRNGPLAIVTLAGRLDGNGSQVFRAFLETHLTPEETHILLLVPQLAGISSAGLRELLVLVKRLAKNNAVPAIAGMSPTISQALEIAGFGALFHRFPDLETALEELAPVHRDKPSFFERLFG